MPEKVSREDIIEDLQNTAKKIDKNFLSCNDYVRHGKHSIDTVYISEWSKFDSWNEAKQAAGLETVEKHSAEGVKNWMEALDGPHPSQKYSDDEILAELRRVYMETGGVLTSDKFDENSEMSKGVIRYRFGSLGKAKEEAGIDDKPKVFREWESKLEGLYGRFTTEEIIEEHITDLYLPWWGEFIEWTNEESSKISIRKPKPNSSKSRKAIFIKKDGSDFRDVMMDRYGDELPGEYIDLFMEYIGKGYSPKTILDGINYLTSEMTQVEGYTSEVSTRNIVEQFKEEGYMDRFPDEYNNCNSDSRKGDEE